MDNKKVGAILIVLVVSVSVIWWQLKSGKVSIESFEACAKAGYPIAQTYPRICRTNDGRTFSE